MMRIKLIVLLLLLIPFYGIAQGDDQKQLVVKGKQIRTEEGDIRLKCNAIELKHKASIVEVSGENAGFWISGKKGKIKEYKDKSMASGFALSPGIYWVYPHLRQNQNKAIVVVKFKRD